jgi:hypothetical protein
VDLTLLLPEEVLEGALLWETWTHCGLGFWFYPYQTIQGVLWAEDISVGDRHDHHHPFRFAVVSLNLPGSPTYNPSIPWVAKLRCPGGPLASDLFIYVDDCSVSAFCDSECWLACQHVARILNHLGI